MKSIVFCWYLCECVCNIVSTLRKGSVSIVLRTDGNLLHGYEKYRQILFCHNHERLNAMFDICSLVNTTICALLLCVVLKYYITLIMKDNCSIPVFYLTCLMYGCNL